MRIPRRDMMCWHRFTAMDVTTVNPNPYPSSKLIPNPNPKPSSNPKTNCIRNHYLNLKSNPNPKPNHNPKSNPNLILT